MILLILLLAVCDAVHMNSQYFKQAVMPSDCTIQPTQQECMEYAQLTMTPDVGYVEVSSGPPAALYVQISSGNPAVEGSPEWVSKSECEAQTGYGNTVNWSTDPSGCIITTDNSVVRWNQYINTISCNSLYTCLQKSPTAAKYVTESECKAYNDANGRSWGLSSYTDLPSGCIVDTNAWTYWNTHSNSNNCATNYKCIQKHSYYNFGHVEVTAGAPALESDIRHVSEKECEAYASTQGKTFTSSTWTNIFQGCFMNSQGNYLFNGGICTANCNCGDSYTCIQRDVITHHAAAEGCLSDTTKVRWNIPFLEVDSGEHATLGIVMPDGTPAVPGSTEYMSPADCEDYADTIGYTYSTNSEGSRPKGCWRFTGSGSSNSLFYNEHATGSGTCTIDWSGYPQYCIQKSTIAAAYVSQEECQVYATSVGDTTYQLVSFANGAPEGCINRDVVGVRYNAATCLTDCNCGGSNDWNCIQKPMTELPCAPHQCICKRGNVVGTTYQAGVRSDRFWEYGEVTSGYNDASISREECTLFGQQQSKTISTGLNGNPMDSGFYPSNCWYDGNWLYFNDNQNAQQCSSTKICLQKVTKTHKFIEVTTGMPATFAVEVSSGSPAQEGSPEWMSESECQAYAEDTGKTWGGAQTWTAPANGCVVRYNSFLYFIENGLTNECDNNPDYKCIQKSPTSAAYVSQAECEQYAMNNGLTWGGAQTWTAPANGCVVRYNSFLYFIENGLTNECDNNPDYKCIQKAPFHAQSVQSIVKQAIDAVLHAEMHYAESVNVFIEDFDHPKTTASDTMYTKQASYDVTDFNFLYSTITADEEWRPALPFNTLEEAKVSCSADSSNCLGVTHRHLGGVDLYLRHNGNSHSQLANHEQEHDERLYFQLLDRPFFIRFPILASQVSNDLKALCDSYPSCFARGNYVNTHDAEWDSSNYPGHTSGNYIAVFYKQFQLQQAAKVNAVYTSPGYVQVSSGSAAAIGDSNYVSEDECKAYNDANGRSWASSGYTERPSGCIVDTGAWTYWNTHSNSNNCATNYKCIQKGGYISVDTLYEAFQGCNASSCEGITGYQEITIGAAATQTVLLDQDLLINDGDDFQLIVYDFQTDDCVGSGGSYTSTTYTDKGTFDVLEACRRGGSTVNPATMFGKRVLHKTAVATETCSEDCTSLGYTVSQMMDSGIRYIQVYYGMLGDTYMSIHNGLPDLSISTANACEAAVNSQSYYTWGGSSSWSNRPKGCHVYRSGSGTSSQPYITYVLWNTHSTTATTCYSWYTSGGSNSWRNLGCFQQYAMEVDADKKVDESECEAYASSVNKPYSDAISSQASDQHENYIPGCQADSVNVYWNPSTTAPRVCGHGGNACIQKVHDATCLCTKKVATSGHNIKTDCFTGFEFKDEVVQVSSGAPDMSVSLEECQAMDNYFSVRQWLTSAKGCIISNTGNINWNAVSFGTDSCDFIGGSCLQKRKACQACPAGTTINANFGDFIQVSSGAADDSVTFAECEQYAINNGLTWGGAHTWTAPANGCVADSAWTYWITNSNSNNCATNYKCIQKAKACDLCPAGSDSTPYSSECFSCPDGESSVPGGRCTNCLAGQFQAGGSGCTNCNAGLYQNENGAAVCKSCPIGSSSNAGSDALTDCNLCTAAYYLVGNTCTICPGGKYSGALASSCTNCAAGTYGQSGFCHHCQAGKFQNEQGKSSCKLCPQGSYLTSTGADNSNDCTSCTAGKYNGNTGQIAESACTNCPAGTISAARSSGCSNCPAGQFQASFGQSQCATCTGGKYQNANGQNGCLNCGAGKYHNNNGQIAESACTNCAAGQSSAPGSKWCTNCAAGKWQGSTGSASCQNCPAGMYQPTEGQNGCLNCDAGQYSGQQATGCSDCVAGQYSGVGDGACLNCNAGKYSAAGSGSCTDCDAGKTSASGQSSCNNCAAGKYASAGDAPCNNCAIGTYAAAGSGACSNCAIGMAVNSEGNDLCDNCDAGTYQNEMGKGTCTNCDAGTYSSAGATSCTNCDAGKYSSAGAGTCTECAKGKYQDNTGQSSCKDCPKGRRADITGRTECERCMWNSYQDQTGQQVCKTPDRCKVESDCQSTMWHYYQRNVECHGQTWARSCTYGGNTNNCRFSHHPGGLVGSQTHVSPTNIYTHSVSGYEACYSYCWSNNQGVSSGFFQIPSNGHCYCYSGSNPYQSGGTYTFQMNC